MINKIYNIVSMEMDNSRVRFNYTSKVTIAIWLTLTVEVFIHVASAFLFLEVNNDGHIYSDVTFNQFAFLLNIFPYLLLCLCSLIVLIDKIIGVLTSFITEDDYVEEHFLSSRIIGVPSYEIENILFLQTIYMVLYITVMPILFLVVFPSWIPLVVIVGVIVGVMYLARFSYRLSKRLRTHINDPNAHTKENA